jgi:hypothetical protein
MFSNNKSTDAKTGWMKVPSLGTAISNALEMIIKELQPTARKWSHLLAPIQSRINVIVKELNEMSDQGEDFAWKNFTDEVQGALEKLKPLMDELAGESPHIPQLISHIHILLTRMPPIINYFNKLDLHHTIEDVLKYTEQLQNNFADVIFAELKKHIPQIEEIRARIEKEYKEMQDADNKKKFSELSAAKKMVLLTGMGELNQQLEEVYLVLNRLSMQWGKGYVLTRPLFANHTLSVNDFYAKFTDFYVTAMESTGFPKPDENLLYPYLEKVIAQQQAMYDEHIAAKEFMIALEKRKKRGIEAIALTLANHIEIRKKSKKPKPGDPIFEKLLANFNHQLKIIGAASAHNILNESIDSLSSADKKIIKDDKFTQILIDSANDTDKSLENLRRDYDRKKKYYEKCIADSTAKRSKPMPDDKTKSPTAAKPKGPKNPNIKTLGTLIEDIYEQAKQTNEILEKRIHAKEINSMDVITKALNYLYGQLDVMLDKNISSQYIHFNSPTTSNIITVSDDDDSPIIHNTTTFSGDGWIINTGKTLAKARELMAEYKKLSAYFSEKKASDVNPELETPKEHLIQFAKKTRDMSIIMKELIACYVALESDPFIVSLLSAGGFQRLFPTTVTEVSIEKPTKKAPSPHQKLTGLDKVFDAIEKFYEKSAKLLLHDDKRIDKTIHSLGKLQGIIQKYRAFKNLDNNVIEPSNVELFSFIITNFSDIHALFQDLPNMISALYLVSGERFGSMIRGLNDGLRKLTRLFKRIEIEFHLEPGYFTHRSLETLLSKDLQQALKINSLPEQMRKTSLHDLITSAYSRIDSFNFTFNPYEHYPFTAAIIDDLQKMYHETPRGTVKKSFLAYQLTQLKMQLIADVKRVTAKKIAEDKALANAANILLEERMEKLQYEYGAEKKIQQSLLKQLLNKGITVKSLDQKLDNIAARKKDQKYFYLLYKGQTKKLIETLQAKAVTRKDIINEIDIQISRLSQNRQQTYYFFAKQRRTTLENTLHAFSELKKFLSLQGNHVKDFANKDPDLYDILVTFDKKFLEKLHRMSQYSVRLSKEKKILGDTPKELEFPADENKKLFILDHQDELIRTRINELQEPSWFSSSIKAKKVRLLSALHDHLKTLPLAVALEAVRKDKTLRPDFYLLHEGKTGKMIKGLSQLYISKKDMLNQIQVEIARLKQKRTVDYFFYAQSKKLLIENRIQACQALAEKLQEPVAGDKSLAMPITQALNELNENDRKILLRYESKLLEEITQWQNEDAKHIRVNVVDRSLHISKEDILNKIRAEIARLKQQRNDLSNSNRKPYIEKSIQACLALAKQLQKPVAGDKSLAMPITQALNELTESHRKILLKYESKLLEEITQWQNKEAEHIHVNVIKRP